MPSEPIYFPDVAALRRWFRSNAGTADELIIGFMKADSGLPSVTWPQAVDEALCVGWIDGVRHRIDAKRYQIRFTPRKPNSNWSAINIRRALALQAEDRLQPAGRAAFEQRTAARSKTASYEQAAVRELNATQTQRFRRTPRAWTFFQSLPASYRKKATWWVISARQQATRDERLARLIAACAQEKRL